MLNVLSVLQHMQLFLFLFCQRTDQVEPYQSKLPDAFDSELAAAVVRLLIQSDLA